MTRRRGLLLALLSVALVATAAGAPVAPATAAVPPAGPLRYVSLGDSYTSGPLVLPHDTSSVPQDCGQSIFNYSHLAAIALQATSFTDVSCGSAEIPDLFAPQRGLPVGGVNRPQLDAVQRNTDVVTLGIGGNDVGFVGLALGCVRLLGPPFEPPCSPAYRPKGRDLVSERIAAVGPTLGHALDAIHAKAPHAQVFVVGYPTALPASARGCWPYLPILQADLPYLVAKFVEMNAMLAHQAATHRATYVDLYAPSIGHDACQVPGVAWVNGVAVVPPSFPAHPNQLGLARSGRVVAVAIRHRLDQLGR